MNQSKKVRNFAKETDGYPELTEESITLKPYSTISLLSSEGYDLWNSSQITADTTTRDKINGTQGKISIEVYID